MARTLVCLRYFLLSCVVVLAISGLLVSIGAGIFIYQLREYRPLTPENVYGPAIILVVMGLLTLSMSIYAWQFMGLTRRAQVIILSVTLTLIALAQIIAGIWAVVRHEEIDTPTPTSLQETFALAIAADKPVWDRMQMRVLRAWTFGVAMTSLNILGSCHLTFVYTKLRCCGIDGPADYRITESIPWSCCDTSNLASPDTTEGACTTMYARGCLHPVLNRTRSLLLHIFLLALGSFVLQIACVAVATCYSKALKKGMRRAGEMSTLPRPKQAAITELEANDNLIISPPKPAKKYKALPNIPSQQRTS